MKFRAKSSEQVAREMAYLSSRYDTTRFRLVDNIIDMKYVENLFGRFAAKVLIKEFFHRFVKIDAVVLVGESMTFVGFHHVFHFHTFRAQRFHNLITLCNVHAWIVSTLRNKQRSFDFVNVKNRRGVAQ